jgi:hypothetical protein
MIVTLTHPTLTAKGQVRLILAILTIYLSPSRQSHKKHWITDNWYKIAEEPISEPICQSTCKNWHPTKSSGQGR